MRDSSQLAVATAAAFASGIVAGAVLWKSYERKQRRMALQSSELPNLRNFDTLRHTSEKATEVITNYLHDIYEPDVNGKPYKYNVLPQIKPGDIIKSLPSAAPNISESWETIFKDLEQHIIPNVGHWQSPNFFSYFKVFSPETSMIGDFVAAGLNTIGFSWISSPAGTELEQVVCEWMRQILGFPSCFSFAAAGGGIINGTASESALSAMIAARNQALTGFSGAERCARASKLVVYCSDQTHCIVQKGCMILDLLNLRVIPTRRGKADADNYGLAAEDVAAAMKEDMDNGFIPFLVVPTIGTTSTLAVDPIAAIVKAARALKPDIWVHVDGAFGGSSAVCPENRHWFEGLENCDSICVNGHKWLLISMDCSFLWVQHRSRLTNALALHPEYLKNEHQNEVNYKDWQVPLSRRFRSLKVWFNLRRMGVEGMRKHIRRSMDLAKRLEGMLQADGRFEIFVPTRMALVCFRVANQPREVTEQLMERVNSSGRVFLIHSVVDNTYILRLGVGGLEMPERNVANVVEVLSNELDNLLGKRV